MKKIGILLMLTAMVFVVKAQENTMSEDEAFKEFLKKQKGIKFKEDVEATPPAAPAVLPPAPPAAPPAPKAEVKVEKKEPTPVAQPKPVEAKKVEPAPAPKAAPAPPAPPKPVEAKKSEPAPAPKAAPAPPKPAEVKKAEPTPTPVAAKPVEKKSEAVAAPAKSAHVFKSFGTLYTLEGERKAGEMKLYIKLDDIQQYSQVLVERGTLGGGYAPCKVINLKPGEYPDGIIETEDKYPLSSRVDCSYRVKVVTTDGSTKTFPPVTIAAGVN